jgi:hypothetical protein
MVADPLALVPALRALEAELRGWAESELRHLKHTKSGVGAAFLQGTQSSYTICADKLAAILHDAETPADPPDWMPSGAELAQHVVLYRRLERAVNELDPAAADDKLQAEWTNAKWNVFNAAVRLVRESNVSRTGAALIAQVEQAELHIQRRQGDPLHLRAEAAGRETPKEKTP